MVHMVALNMWTVLNNTGLYFRHMPSPRRFDQRHISTEEAAQEVEVEAVEATTGVVLHSLRTSITISSPVS
jgi:hypothetical protein